MNQKLNFTRVSNAAIENLESFILEAYVDEKQVADILCINGKWYVTLMAENNALIRINLQNWLEINHEFAKFVNMENEVMLLQAKDKNKPIDDVN